MCVSPTIGRLGFYEDCAGWAQAVRQDTGHRPTDCDGHPLPGWPSHPHRVRGQYYSERTQLARPSGKQSQIV